MGTRIACLFFLTALSVCQAEDGPPCSCFEGGVYTTVKSLNFSEATYCIGWSDLPEGAEIPLGVTPTPDFVLKPHEWTVTSVPTTPVALGETKYLLVFTASLYGPDKVYYSDMVTHAEPFTVRHVAAEASAATASAGRVDLRNLREYQAALSEISQELRAIETIAPSLRPGLEEMLEDLAQMSANPEDANLTAAIRFLNDVAGELKRSDSPLRSEEGVLALEAEFLDRAKTDLKVARDLIAQKFQRLPIERSESTGAAGFSEAKALIELCKKWKVPLSDSDVASILSEPSPEKVRMIVFDRLWEEVAAQAPPLWASSEARSIYLIQAALTKRIEPAHLSLSPEAIIGEALDRNYAWVPDSGKIDRHFASRLLGLERLLLSNQIQRYWLDPDAPYPHVASVMDQGD